MENCKKAEFDITDFPTVPEMFVSPLKQVAELVGDLRTKGFVAITAEANEDFRNGVECYLSQHDRTNQTVSR